MIVSNKGSLGQETEFLNSPSETRDSPTRSCASIEELKTRTVSARSVLLRVRQSPVIVLKLTPAPRLRGGRLRGGRLGGAPVRASSCAEESGDRS